MTCLLVYMFPSVLVLLFLIQLQDSHERILRDFHVPNHLQTFLALLLFLEQFLLAGDIAAIAFCEHILACGFDVGGSLHTTQGSAVQTCRGNEPVAHVPSVRHGTVPNLSAHQPDSGPCERACIPV